MTTPHLDMLMANQYAVFVTIKIPFRSPPRKQNKGREKRKSLFDMLKQEKGRSCIAPPPA